MDRERNDIKKDRLKMKPLSKKRVLKHIISVFIAIIVFTICSPYAEAVDAEVYATLDEHNIDYTLNTSTPNNIVISGNITCNIEGLGDNIYDVRVDIWSTAQNWECSVSPPIMTFTFNGKKPFNLTMNIPINTHNNTMDTVSIAGLWETTFSTSMLGNMGDVTPDSVNVTIYRKKYTPTPENIEDENGGYSPWWEIIGLENITIMILIPLIIIIAGILYFKSRKKKNKELLDN